MNCGKLRVLPRGIGKLGAFKTIEYCGKLRALPRQIGELGALKQGAANGNRRAAVHRSPHGDA